MKSYTYQQIAESYVLWMEYVDTMGLDSEEEFEAKSVADKVAFMTACFGKEEPDQLQPF